MGLRRAELAIVRDFKEGRLGRKEVSDVALAARHLDFDRVTEQLGHWFTHRVDSGDKVRLAELTVLLALEEAGHRNVAPWVGKAVRAAEGDRNFHRLLVKVWCRVDPQAAAAYGGEFLGRLNFDLGTAARFLDAFVVAGATDVVGPLEAWGRGDPEREGKLLATRIRLGDQAARSRVLDWAKAAEPPHRRLADAVSALGDNPDDLDALLQFAKWRSPIGDEAVKALLRYVEHLEPAFKEHHARIRTELPTLNIHEDFTDFYAIMFLVGDRRKGNALLKRIHPSNKSPLGRAAELALRVGVPDAEERVLEVILNPDIRGGRKGLLAAVATKLGARDPRWAIALIHTSADMRHEAATTFIRSPTEAACPLLVAALRQLPADTPAQEIQAALVPLTALPPRACADRFEALALEPDLGANIRTAVIQTLVLMESEIVIPILEGAGLSEVDTRTTQNMHRLVFGGRG